MRTRVWWICGGALALAISGVVGGLRSCSGAVLEPFQAGLAGEGRTPAEDELAVAREQIARLGAENVILADRLAQYAAIPGEVLAQRQVVARGRILSRSTRSGRRYLELDVGRLEGVAKGMAVCAGWSLTGLVAGTDDGRCLVQVVSDHEFRVAATVIAPAGPQTPAKALCEGVLAGRGRRGEFGLDHLDAPPGLELLPGLAVVTAGTDGRLPYGLVLGTITAASRSTGERWDITVVPERDPEQHESLLVVRFDR